MRLEGKTAIVTGGGTGIGRAVVELYAREGAKVVIAETVTERGEEVARAVAGCGGQATFVWCDISQAQQVKMMVEETVRQYGGVDILVNNAAVQLHGQDARAHELAEEVWDRTMGVNLRGVWLCSKYVIPAMLQRGGGSIIHIASPTGLTGCAPTYTAYSTSKGGVFALTKIMAVDYGRDNIRVNAIVPGTTETPLIASLISDRQVRARLEAKSPLGRLGTPEDVAPLAVFLGSDESLYCTGGFYLVEGGMLAM